MVDRSFRRSKSKSSLPARLRRGVFRPSRGYSLSPSGDTDSSDPVLKYISQMLMEENMEEQPWEFANQVALQNAEKSLYDALGQQHSEVSDQSPSQLVLSHNIESPNSKLSGSSSARGSLDAASVTENSDLDFQSNADSSSRMLSKSSSSITNYDGSEESLHELLVKSIFTASESMVQFKKGLEEASKFLPTNNQLGINPGDSKPPSETEKGTPRMRISEEINMRRSTDKFKGLKNHKRDEDAFDEGKAKKQTALYTEESEFSDLFDKLLLCNENGGGYVFRTANESLKQIRENSSPSGDASQRLAHYFANGLEARLVGSGTRMQHLFSIYVARRTSAADILKAYHLHISTCPFSKLSICFANYMILRFAEKATTLHIIDFGIGFEKLEETGRHLEKCCKRFNVPFEFNYIVSKNWESVKLEDLKIQSNEIVAVNSSDRFRILLDETVGDNSCEGSERVERSETYKQWQVRHMRAGFKALPLDQELMKFFRGKMKEWYHKDFALNEDGNWMLQAWRGRIIIGSSCWVPI
ncbi:hypothetical protein EUGRSUZ_B02347 [Eucalyptus grandis]|uniref:Uncharacterized protein n=2 Tax=Eucalyptus grandis TaxID=71139 RepID=A0ACC3LUE0_EUCGR|nr:hypothetical protein EUGRSUZ_B02347 [Eucalyptus grandis]